MSSILTTWKRGCAIAFLVIFAVVVSVGCFPNTAVAQEEAELLLFGPPLPSNLFRPSDPSNPALVDLGRKLYYEKRLSKNQDISCNSCHKLNRYGVDNQPVSPGHRGQLGERNSPSVYNAAAAIAQFWDGRAADVEAQALGPILNPVEMAMPSRKKVLAVLKSMPDYVKDFEAAFPEKSKPMTFKNVGKAIGAFERGLVTPSPFDRYLAGDKSALNDGQKDGLKLFVGAGCVGCHNGTYVGGQMYQKLGLVHPWSDLQDLGRYKVTGQEFDRMVFKVPSLRNVAETAPYFHQGSVKTLDEAVRLMAWHQLGREFSDQQVEDLVAFLGSLTGELPIEYIQEPTLPESTKSTPKPKAN